MPGNRSDCARAVVFLHGFSGDSVMTPGIPLPRFGSAQLMELCPDIYTLGYAMFANFTRQPSQDVGRVQRHPHPTYWVFGSGDPDLPILASVGLVASRLGGTLSRPLPEVDLRNRQAA